MPGNLLMFYQGYIKGYKSEPPPSNFVLYRPFPIYTIQANERNLNK